VVCILCARVVSVVSLTACYRLLWESGESWHGVHAGAIGQGVQQQRVHVRRGVGGALRFERRRQHFDDALCGGVQHGGVRADRRADVPQGGVHPVPRQHLFIEPSDRGGQRGEAAVHAVPAQLPDERGGQNVGAGLRMQRRGEQRERCMWIMRWRVVSGQPCQCVPGVPKRIDVASWVCGASVVHVPPWNPRDVGGRVRALSAKHVLGERGRGMQPLPWRDGDGRDRERVIERLCLREWLCDARWALHFAFSWLM